MRTQEMAREFMVERLFSHHRPAPSTQVTHQRNEQRHDIIRLDAARAHDAIPERPASNCRRREQEQDADDGCGAEAEFEVGAVVRRRVRRRRRRR